MTHPSQTDQSPGEMSCRELVEAITDYIEGAMPAAQTRRLEAHLEQCPYCVSYIEQMRQTIDALGAIDVDSLSARTREELLDAFRNWRAG